MTQTNTRLGIWLMIATTLVFAIQDGISQHLAREYNVLMVVMIRYWFFAAFVITIATRQSGSIRAAAATQQPILQAFRGILLAAEICVMVGAFAILGLVESHAIFACYPLLIAVLSAFMFALYGLLTRYAAKKDTTATSFFWTIGIWFWEPMSGHDWLWMGSLCITGAVGHWLLIKCYEVAEASAVQPFAYLQMVFASAIGLIIFRETLEPHVALGAAIIVAAGLFTLIRARRAKPIR